MIIERTTQPEKVYYEEIVNLQLQYKKILKNPAKKVYNAKIVLSLVLLLMFIAGIIFAVIIAGGYKCTTFKIIVLTVDGLLAVLIALRLFGVVKAVNEYLKRPCKTVYTVDEKGIQYESEYTTFKMPWENVLVIRVLKNSIAFIGNEKQPIIMGFEKKDGLLVFNYMKRNNIQILTVE